MNTFTKSRGVLWLFCLTLFAGLCVPGYATTKTKYEALIFVPMHGFEADGFCGTLSGSVSAGNFFKGLQRIESDRGVEFRRKSLNVRNFPDELDIALEGPIGSCPLSLPNSATSDSLADFVKGLKVEAEWIDGNASQTVGDLSVTKFPPITRWFAEYERPTWQLQIKVPSKDVAITRALVVSLVSDSGHKVMNYSFSL
ncbi:MAG: hypothetical protein WAN72_02965 [Candidatus Acidiferrales bacterium]